MKFQVLFAIISLVQFSAAMTGFSLQEVELVDPSTICADCEEIICTLTSFEPAGSGVEYVKYTMTVAQTALLPLTVEPGPDTFEACATAAYDSSAPTFFWDGTTCSINGNTLTRESETDCDYTDRKMVYILEF